jgi:hypothetical protein
MKPEAIWVLGIFITFAVLEMWRTNFFHKPTQTRTDIWDVLFGTAKITRKYPAEIGVENLPPISAAEQLAWPVFRSEGSRIT